MDAQIVCPQRDGVEGVFPADQELLQQPDLAGIVSGGDEPGVEVGVVVQAEGGLGPGAVRGLGHHRVADLVAEGHRLLGPVDQLVARARNSDRRQHRLHLRLVADVGRHPLRHPLDAQHVSGLGQRHLQLLQSADQPLHLPDLTGQAADRIDDLLRVESVGDLPMPDQGLLQLR